MGHWVYSANPPYWDEGVGGIEAKAWTGDDDRPMPSVGDETEHIRERDWADLEAEAREFVEKYGAAAMLRCISDSLK